MIRHRPFGLGHPYRLEPDQRVSVWPVEGAPIEQRATSGSDLDDVVVELTVDGRASRLSLEPTASGEGRSPGEPVSAHGQPPSATDGQPAATDGRRAAGHLAGAATRQAGRGQPPYGRRSSPGSDHRSPRKRPKSESKDTTRARCSMARAARCASPTRLPAVPVSASSPARMSR